MKIKRITHFSKSALLDLNKLLLQLSSSKKQMMPSQLKGIIKNKNIYLLAAIEDNKIIGTATLAKVDQITGREGYVESVVVDEKYRGKGFGKKLMMYLISLAKNLKIDYLTLTSNPKRKIANKMYKNIGFSIYKTNVYEMELKNKSQQL